jgi:hypothetical protein
MTKKVRRFATRTIHDVPLTFEDETGKRVEEKFAVVYRSYSTKAIEEFEKSLEADKRDDGTVPFSAMLEKLVVSIVDSDGDALTDDSGEPAKLSREFFASIPVAEAKLLYESINNDIFPHLASPAVTSSGSQVAGSEA